MQKISDRIYVGAMTFLKREYSIIFVFMVIVFVALLLLLSVWTAIAYLTGAVCSMLAGVIALRAKMATLHLPRDVKVEIEAIAIK